MAITHSNFLTQVRNYTEVGSTVLTDAIIQDFIRSVELDVAGKVAGIADRFIQTKEEKAAFEMEMEKIFIEAEAEIQKNVTEIIDKYNKHKTEDLLHMKQPNGQKDKLLHKLHRSLLDLVLMKPSLKD